MKILNLIWGFTLGAGIDKCYTTYASLGKRDNNVEMKNICINIKNIPSHTGPLKTINTIFIDIKNRRDFSWINKLYSLIKQEHPDVIFTHGFNGAIVMLIERIVHGVKTKLICSYHGAYHPPTALKKTIAPLYNALPLAVYKYYAYRIICVENFSNEYLVKKGVPANKVITVHNGISNLPDPSPVNLKSYSHSGVTILTASRISEVKGLPYLIDALTLIKNQGYDFHYFMLGEGPDLDMLKQKVANLQLESHVTFVGYQDNIPEWMAACDIFALPSLHEYHSIAILEAMRAGKAIVATDVGGNGESIRSGIDGLLVPSRDSKSLAEALLQMIKNANSRRLMGENARERFRSEFTEEVMQRKLIKVLKS